MKYKNILFINCHLQLCFARLRFYQCVLKYWTLHGCKFLNTFPKIRECNKWKVPIFYFLF